MLNDWPGFALQLRRGSLRSSLRFERRLVEAGGVERLTMKNCKWALFLAFLLISTCYRIFNDLQ